MAAIFWSAPGLEYGPCLDPCAHKMCFYIRESAERPCRLCGKPIGYETQFYGPPGEEAHARCVEAEVPA